MVFSIADLLTQWEVVGVFDYVLPFLLIFAVVFGIMTSTQVLSKNKGVNVLIALIVGLLSIRLDFVQNFFIQVFPRLGVGLAAFLVVLILIGAFVPSGKGRKAMIWILMGIGAIIAIIVLGGSFQEYGWLDNLGDSDMIVWIVSIALVIGVIVVIAVTKGDNSDDSDGQIILPLRGRAE